MPSVPISRHTTTRLVLALGLTQTLAWASSFYLPAILAEPMARDAGVAPSVVFGIFSGALMLSGLLGPLVGGRIDETGGRGVVASSNLVFAAGLITLSQVTGLPGLAAGWLLIGFAMGMGLYDAAFALLTRTYGRDARGPITGVTLVAGFASTVGWPLTAWLEARYGWRSACLVWALVHLGVALPVNLWMLPRRSAPPPRPAPLDISGNTRRRITAPMVLVSFLFAATLFAASSMAAHMPRLLVDFGTEPATAILAASLIGPAQVAARLIEFGFLRRLDPLIAARIALCAHPLGAAAMFVFGAPAALVFGLLHGAGNGLLTIAKGTLPLSLFGPDGFGRRQGWLMAPAQIAQALAPFGFALIMERLGAAALWISAMLVTAALLSTILLGRMAGRSPGA